MGTDLGLEPGVRNPDILVVIDIINSILWSRSAVEEKDVQVFRLLELGLGVRVQRLGSGGHQARVEACGVCIRGKLPALSLRIISSLDVPSLFFSSATMKRTRRESFARPRIRETSNCTPS